MTETPFNNVFNNRKVLLTGHTGFKGSWMTLLLKRSGADVYGYALDPPTHPNLFNEARVDELITSYIGDIRDYNYLFKVVREVRPEVIIHMAAQPLVFKSYNDPVETYSTNVMGTVNLLDVVRQTSGIKALVNVTSDKCYENREWYWGYRENDPLGGQDPYSSSKSCSELVTTAYRQSFFSKPDSSSKSMAAVATARAGNIIGGGDWGENRLIPDFIRAVSKGEKLLIRSPLATRPWQHALDALTGYLTLTKKLLTEGTRFAQSWNFAPDSKDAQNVEWVAKTICDMWGDDASFETDTRTVPHETKHLQLDSSKAKAELGWSPKWTVEKALERVVEWNKAFLQGQDMKKITEEQIEHYFSV